VRGLAGRVRLLAGRYDQPGCVLLGGDHDERAAVELAGGLGAVDEPRHPRDGLVGLVAVAVVDSELAAAAVLAGLGDVRVELIDDQADATDGQAGDPLAGLAEWRAVVVGTVASLCCCKFGSPWMIVGEVTQRTGRVGA
jgi:hypothetical protein